MPDEIVKITRHDLEKALNKCWDEGWNQALDRLVRLGIVRWIDIANQYKLEEETL